MREHLKKAVILFTGFSLFACATCVHATQHEETLYQKAQRAAVALEGRLPATELQQLVLDLGGPDPQKARIAVRRFAELEENKMVALALEYPASSVRIEAARQLKGSMGREILPSVVDALERANNDLLFGGSEVSIANRQLKTLLIGVICEATGCDPREVPVEDGASVRNLIANVRQSLR